MTIKDRVLVVEDEKSISGLIKAILTANGYDVITASTGNEAFSMISSHCPDLVVLDLGLPDMDGMEIIKAVRSWTSLPIIVVSARSYERDKVKALDMGADDYVTKPFDVKELLARVHAVMRRTDADAPVEKKLTFDKLVINLESYELIVDGVKIDTPPKEMELLYHLAASPNRVFTRNQLLDEVWGFDYFGDSRTVDVHVKRLREKLEGVSDKWCLKTVWGVGYKFEVHE